MLNLKRLYNVPSNCYGVAIQHIRLVTASREDQPNGTTTTCGADGLDASSGIVLSREDMTVGREFKNEVFKAGEILFGTFYPKRYMVAGFDTSEQANQAVEALKQAGFEDVRHWTPAQVLERHQHFLEQRGAVQRAEGELSSEEKDALNDYLALAKQGHHFVTVYVPEESEVEQAESILESHDAHATHYYGDWQIIDLSTNEPRG